MAASSSAGSSSDSSRSSSTSLWRKRALSSKFIFASSAITSPDLVTTSGIDLDDGGVELDEGAIHGGDELQRRRDLVALEPQAIGDAPGVKGHQPGGRIDGHLDDLLRRVAGDVLDLHAALGRGHHDHPEGAAIDQHAEIELAIDVDAGLDIDPVDFFALGAGLMGDQLLAQHTRCRGLRLGRAAGELDAPGLAPAAGMDLGLDRPDRAAQRFGRFPRLGGGIGDGAPGNRDPELTHQALGLILVNVHPLFFIDAGKWR